MTAYKLVTIDAPYWGFGKRLEQVLLAVSVINFYSSSYTLAFLSLFEY